MQLTPTCGTHRGYYWHLRHNQKPCDPCNTARAQYETARNIITRRTDAFMAPHDAVTDLYLNATIAAQERFEEAVGDVVVNALVARADANTDTQEVA